MKEAKNRNSMKVIATNKTNPILMKIARREKWISPFAKKMTINDAIKVKELNFRKLFMMYVPATDEDEFVLDSGNGKYCVPVEIIYNDISIFNSDIIIDSEGKKYHFADFLEKKQAYTFEVWNTIPDAKLESFTEFQYFTNVRDIPPYAFYRFKKLKIISLPPSIKSIGKRAFHGCSSLKIINSEFPIVNYKELY